MIAERVHSLDPRSIVNLMISFASQRDFKLTHVSIQKLLYFAHATYLVRYNVPLVAGYFEAWEYGPVHRVIYDALKVKGRSPVVDEIYRVDPFTKQMLPPHPVDSMQVKDHVDDIMRRMGSLPPGRLIDLSHAPGGPWHHVWNKSQTEPVLSNRISDTIILQLFPRIKAGVSPEPRYGDVDEATPLADD